MFLDEPVVLRLIKKEGEEVDGMQPLPEMGGMGYRVIVTCAVANTNPDALSTIV